MGLAFSFFTVRNKVAGFYVVHLENSILMMMFATIILKQLSQQQGADDHATAVTWRSFVKSRAKKATFSLIMHERERESSVFAAFAVMMLTQLCIPT